MTTKANYTTVAVVKDYLKITTAQEDTTIARLITASSDWIDQWTQRTFGNADMTHVLNGNGQRRLNMPEDLVSVTTLEVALYEGASYTTIPSSDYFLEPIDGPPDWPFQWIEFGVLPTQTIAAFYRGHRTVRVTGNWGWVAIPAAISEACVEITAAIQKRRLAGFMDTVGVTELGTPIIGKFVPEYVKTTLAMYRSLFMTSSSAAS